MALFEIRFVRKQHDARNACAAAPAAPSMQLNAQAQHESWSQLRLLHQMSFTITKQARACLSQWTNLLIGGGVRLGRQAMADALQASLQRLETDRLDLWQM